MILKISESTFLMNKIHKIWWLIQWLWVIFRKREGKKNESKISDLNSLMFVRTSVVIRKQRKGQML